MKLKCGRAIARRAPPSPRLKHRETCLGKLLEPRSVVVESQPNRILVPEGSGFLGSLLASGKKRAGLALLGLAFHHPSSSSDIQGDVQMGLDYWGPKLDLTKKETEAGMAAGRGLDLAQTAAGILAKSP
ncbi:MAG TPA: hypothetical protein VLD63_12665 [Anaerolineales bacterium]|nr:hypothetical protein [Anaerolineales bacterium]